MISGSEVAFFSLDQNILHDLESQDSKRAQYISNLMDKPQYLLSTILIANNLINIGIIVLSGYLINLIFPESIFNQWGQSITETPVLNLVSPSTWAIVIQFLITVVFVTFLLVLFGEVTPKIYANRNNVKFAHMMAAPLLFFRKLLYPISSLLVKWSNKVNKTSKNGSQSSTSASKEEIDKAIELTVTDGTNTEDERDILKGIVNFSDMAAKQIMKNRTDIIAVDIAMSYEELIEEVKSHGLSRIPVYEGNIDTIKGILYAKDLIGPIHNKEEINWADIVRTNVLYAPESKMINELLKEFQTEKMHMAIIVDEYGGTAGLITMEDILEEVIGDIKDEFDDEEETDFIQLDEKNYVFEGKILLQDMCRALDINSSIFDDVRGDSDSLAGVLLEISGQIPRLNHEIRFSRYIFKILAVNKRRIQQVKVTLLD